MTAEVFSKSEVQNICFKKHFLRRGKKAPKELCGLTMIVDVDVQIKIGDIELDIFTINSTSMLTAEEFNKLKTSPLVTGGD